MLLADAKPVHARWSEVNREFLEFVERNPACLDRASFASIYADPSMQYFPIQPWPLFVGAEQRREMEAVALGMDRLVKDVLERFLENDPKRLVEFYGTKGTMDGAPSLVLELSEDMLALILEEPNGVRSAPSRADYIETRDGLQCIEYNAGACLGGMQNDAIAELYLEAAPTARFLREGGRRARGSGLLRAFFRHLVEDTADLGVWRGGDFNVAVAVRPHAPGRIAMHSAEIYTRELCRVLDERAGAPRGRVLLCALDELVQERGGAVSLGGHPVHAVVEQDNGEGDIRPVFRAFKMGGVNLFSGPISHVLRDKRNLVLLSEHAGSDEFTAAERSLIERHLPWTRRLLPGRTTRRGRAVRLPEALLEGREAFVLKKASSVGGTFVEIGRLRSDAEWKEAIRRALWEEDWVVQEYLETVPYVFQSGETGAARHELVWGLFAFGDHFGGAWLRMQAQGGHGVVNARRGAETGALLEVVE
ncbi:MAG TPA: hypothetical protein VEX86_08325 [Longimicrobium sp.]|nr:hypothetical protein [Longimicrobium sp.]